MLSNNPDWNPYSPLVKSSLNRLQLDGHFPWIWLCAYWAVACGAVETYRAFRKSKLQVTTRNTKRWHVFGLEAILYKRSNDPLFLNLRITVLVAQAVCNLKVNLRIVWVNFAANSKRPEKVEDDLDSTKDGETSKKAHRASNQAQFSLNCHLHAYSLPSRFILMAEKLQPSPPSRSRPRLLFQSRRTLPLGVHAPKW